MPAARTLSPGSTRSTRDRPISPRCARAGPTPTPDVLIRPAAAGDEAAIRRLVEAAFGRPDEARLVDALRERDELAFSLVATHGSSIVGHVALSPMTAPFRALGLAPLSVQPEFQRQGIGNALMHDAIARAAAAGWDAIFLLGDADYYGRFGFTAAAAAGFTCDYAGAHFLALPLSGVLPASEGTIAYASAFATL
jgi:putative acetyltransferase